MIYEIKHRITGNVLFSLECRSIKLCVEAAVRVGADLRDADLRDANLGGADLGGADLRGADVIDAGQDRRGFRFWAWRNKDGVTVYRAGCHEWADFAEALAWYGEGYKSTGDRHECLARLALLGDEAARRGW